MTVAPLVLLAVGDPAAAEPLPTLLRLSGYRTTTARTGAEAPARVRECRFDLMILDVLLPASPNSPASLASPASRCVRATAATPTAA